MKLLWIGVGAAVGYVLGTKAGRERYEQLKATAADWADKPVVTDAIGTVGALADRGKEAVTTKVNTVARKAKDAANAKLPPSAGTTTQTTPYPATG